VSIFRRGIIIIVLLLSLTLVLAACGGGDDGGDDTTDEDTTTDVQSDNGDTTDEGDDADEGDADEGDEADEMDATDEADEGDEADADTEESDEADADTEESDEGDTEDSDEDDAGTATGSIEIPEDAPTMTIRSNLVEIRGQQSAVSGSVVATLQVDETASIIGVSENGDWYLISNGEWQGWITRWGANLYRIEGDTSGLPTSDYTAESE
jgi:hypothetical protein